MSGDIGPAIVTGVSTLLAGVGGTFGRDFFVARKERKTIRRALMAEINSMIDIATARGYRESLLQGVNGQLQSLEIQIPADYRPVFTANASKLGMLDERDAELIVRFHHCLDGIIQDVKPGGLLASGKGGMEMFQNTLALYDFGQQCWHELYERSR